MFVDSDYDQALANMEGQSFEKHEISQPETGLEVDIEMVLETGEIVSKETLEGYFPIQVVQIKNDGKALFRPDSKDGRLRYDLELLAARVDEILGFELVPTVVLRNLEDNNGSMQRFVEDAKPAISLSEDWVNLVDKDELVKAAVFDYLIGNTERHGGNFLINPETGKIWLIDHDHVSLINKHIFLNKIMWAALREGPIKLSDEVKDRLKILLAQLDSVQEGQHPDVKQLLNSLKERAQKLLEVGVLS